MTPFTIKTDINSYQVYAQINKYGATPIVKVKCTVWWWHKPIWRKVWEGKSHDAEKVKRYGPTTFLTWFEEAVKEYENYTKQWGDYYV